MSQVTLYLDDETDALLTKGAADSGLSKSRWAAQLIRRHAGDDWAQECRDLAGAFPDFPLRDAAPEAPSAQDTPRVGF